jgi:hypothetical protein
MKINKLIWFAPALMAAAPAMAAETITYTVGTTKAFNTTYTYTAPYKLVLDIVVSSTQGYLKGKLNPASDINFSSAYVTVNGSSSPVNLSVDSTGVYELRSLMNSALAAGDVINLYLSGTSGKSASYTVTLGIAAVPEVSTWIMMILGFGATAYAMRKRKHQVLAAA